MISSQFIWMWCKIPHKRPCWALFCNLCSEGLLMIRCTFHCTKIAIRFTHWMVDHSVGYLVKHETKSPMFNLFHLDNISFLCEMQALDGWVINVGALESKESITCICSAVCSETPCSAVQCSKIQCSAVQSRAVNSALSSEQCRCAVCSLMCSV